MIIENMQHALEMGHFQHVKTLYYLRGIYNEHIRFRIT